MGFSEIEAESMKLHEKVLRIDTKGSTIKICYSLKEKRDQNQTFLHEFWLDCQKLWQVSKMNGGVWNYIKLSIIQDQPEHTGSIRLDLARERRCVV